MFLNSLRIRGKLAVLIVLPLIAILGLSVWVVISQSRVVVRADSTVSAVSRSSRVGAIVAGLQQERLISLGYLIGVASPSDLAVQSAEVNDQIADLVAAEGSDLPQRIHDALIESDGLTPLRAMIVERKATTDQVLAGFGSAIAGVLDAMRLVDGIDTSVSQGREVVALDALLHIDELTNESAAYLLAIAGSNEMSPGHPDQQAVIGYAADQVSITQSLPRFKAYGTAAEVAMHDLVSQAFIDRVGPAFAPSFAQDPNATAQVLSPPVVYPQMQSFVVLGRFAEQKIAADVIASLETQRNNALVAAYLTGLLGVVVVAGVASLGFLVARSVAVPLAQLTASTNRVARAAEAELMRVADDEESEASGRLPAAPIAFEPVQIASADEIGELARAFERISRTSVQLVARQVTSRRNVAQMFGHVGRRTQNLVGRQIALIDGLESQETDTRRLSELYRLDHLTSRLRRNASSLVALSGASDPGGHFAPLPLVDVIRLALGEIEGYTRVDVDASPRLQVAPGAINDIVLLLAELMENATVFSPPQTRVTVSANEDPPLVTIVDHGLGLAPDRMAEENSRLDQRERLDLAPTEVLGLFVVGRLARRHGILVSLSPTAGGGVTVTVDLSQALLVRGPGYVADIRTDITEQSWDKPDEHAADAPFDAETFDRANQYLKSSKPWNAFALPIPALTAGPSAPLPVTPPPPVAPAPVAVNGWVADHPSDRDWARIGAEEPAATTVDVWPSAAAPAPAFGDDPSDELANARFQADALADAIAAADAAIADATAAHVTTGAPDGGWVVEAALPGRAAPEVPAGYLTDRAPSGAYDAWVQPDGRVTAFDDTAVYPVLDGYHDNEPTVPSQAAPPVVAAVTPVTPFVPAAPPIPDVPGARTEQLGDNLPRRREATFTDFTEPAPFPGFTPGPRFGAATEPPAYESHGYAEPEPFPGFARVEPFPGFTPSVPSTEPFEPPTVPVSEAYDPSAHPGLDPYDPPTVPAMAQAPAPPAPYTLPKVPGSPPVQRHQPDSRTIPDGPTAGPLSGDRESTTVVFAAVSSGAVPLTRRVPGATTRGEMRLAPVAKVVPQNPDEVRDLLEQFESGVARALREVRPEPTEEEQN